MFLELKYLREHKKYKHEGEDISVNICSRYENTRNEVRSQCQSQSDLKWYTPL